MKKRLLFLEILRKILVGDSLSTHRVHAGQRKPEESTSQNKIEHADHGSYAADLPLEGSVSDDIANLPLVGEKIRDLLCSTDWEEVNQGLELLAASLQEKELTALHGLIDVGRLQIREPVLWGQTLGITTVNEINAVAKVASLTGALREVTRIDVNGTLFAGSDLSIDLSLLSEALHLEELIINGVNVCSPGKVSELSQLRRLVLSPDCLDWDHEEDADCFKGLEQLEMLTVGTWPWEDLIPLEECGSLKSLRIRGGEIENVEGITSLTSLRHIELRDCYSLNQIDGIETLEELETLVLCNVSLGETAALSGLGRLRSIMLESSESIDLSGLGGLNSLEKAEIDCGEGEGFGELASCENLKYLKLSSCPDYICGESRLRLSQRELETLLAYWKNPNTKRNKVSGSYGEGIESVLMVFGINIFECLSGQISVGTFSERVTRLTQKHAEELNKRCYWPWIDGSELGCSPTHPIGRWLEKARLAGSMSDESCKEFSIALSKLLPQSPQR